MLVCKNYNLKKDSEISIGGERYSVIKLGEYGRGRIQEYVIVEEDIHTYEKVVVEKVRNIYKIRNIKENEDKETDLWIARINTELRYKRNCFGHIKVKESQKDNIQVVEYGIGAYGEAGRIGEWIDYLIVIKDGTIIKISPSGSYAHEKYFLYFLKDKVLRFSKEEKDIYEAMNEVAYDVEEPFEVVVKKTEEG